jgi:L-fuconolactonase
MRLVDSQVHVWGADSPERPWPARGKAHRDVALGADELLAAMDDAGVERAVLVPPSWEGDRNDLALAAALAHPRRFAVMGRLDGESAGAPERMARWKEQPGMLGLRFLFHTPLLRAPFIDGRLDWVWGAAERAGLPVMVLLHHADLDRARSIAERHPGLRLAIDHLGLKTGEKDAEAFRDLDRLLALARFPQVAVKTSALPCYTAEEYPYRGLQPYIRRVYDAFGPRRMFWGTDYSRLPCTYRQAIAMFTEEIPWLGREDREWIMGRALSEWLDWND